MTANVTSFKKGNRSGGRPRGAKDTVGKIMREAIADAAAMTKDRKDGGKAEMTRMFWAMKFSEVTAERVAFARLAVDAFVPKKVELEAGDTLADLLTESFEPAALDVL